MSPEAAGERPPLKAAAVLVAAGSGTRMGRPKQFLPLGGRTVVEWSLAAFSALEEVEKIILVLSAEHVKEHGAKLSSARVQVIEGGKTRLDSVRRGFACVGEDCDVVAVHDGARPLVSAEVVRAVLQEAYESGAAVAAVPVKDTLKKVTNKQLWVSQTPVRSSYWAAQTPQGYRREILEEALAKFPALKDATDESQLVEKAGKKVKIVPSSYENFKITTPEDLVMAEALLEERQGGRRRTAVGFGFDIHRFAPGRELWLAGVKLDYPKGLLGHSDGDAALHAAADAILGALGSGDIGLMFPSENPKIKNIPSKDIVAAVMAKLITAGGVLAHLDVTLVAQEPKLSPHYERFRESIAAIFGVPRERVNVKAKSHEGLESVGRGEALACYAVATLLLPESSAAPKA
ncbi:MAG: 2-C-methyl-D-erythritol 4-phosphate cytidylyltransferase [Elusimicrobia bacterium]|nr:2-C-methyl-D-erythritol 4-phosphate cytidylyltransferase [Elusimicrobiota bacterium]